jgi:hypothetical protein
MAKVLVDRRAFIKQTAGVVAGTLAAPMIGRAEANTIKIGMQSILSGRVAQLGTSSRNAVMIEVERINASGGLAGRMIDMVIRDSKGQPQVYQPELDLTVCAWFERSGFVSGGSGCDHFLLRHRHGIQEGLHRGFAEAPASLMRPHLIIFFDPRIQIGLQFID